MLLFEGKLKTKDLIVDCGFDHAYCNLLCSSKSFNFYKACGKCPKLVNLENFKYEVGLWYIELFAMEGVNLFDSITSEAIKIIGTLTNVNN